MKKLALALMMCGLVGCGEDAPQTPVERCAQVFIKNEGQEAVNRECNSLSWEAMKEAKARVLEIDPTNKVKILNEPEETPLVKEPEKPKIVNQADFGPSIGLSAQQVLKGLDEYGITLQDAPLSTGEKRLMGQANKTMAVAGLEIMGDENNINRTTLMIIPVSDNSLMNLGNIACIATFLNNALPEWKGAFKWTSDAIGDVANAKATMHKKEIIKGNKRLSVNFIETLSMFFITVEHKDRKQSVDNE